MASFRLGTKMGGIEQEYQLLGLSGAMACEQTFSEALKFLIEICRYGALQAPQTQAATKGLKQLVECDILEAAKLASQRSNSTNIRLVNQLSRLLPRYIGLKRRKVLLKALSQALIRMKRGGGVGDTDGDEDEEPLRLTELPFDVHKQVLALLGPLELATLACTSRYFADLVVADQALWQPCLDGFTFTDEISTLVRTRHCFQSLAIKRTLPGFQMPPSSPCNTLHTTPNNHCLPHTSSAAAKDTDSPDSRPRPSTCSPHGDGAASAVATPPLGQSEPSATTAAQGALWALKPCAAYEAFADLVKQHKCAWVWRGACFAVGGQCVWMPVVARTLGCSWRIAGCTAVLDAHKHTQLACVQLRLVRSSIPVDTTQPGCTRVVAGVEAPPPMPGALDCAMGSGDAGPSVQEPCEYYAEALPLSSAPAAFALFDRFFQTTTTGATEVPAVQWSALQGGQDMLLSAQGAHVAPGVGVAKPLQLKRWHSLHVRWLDTDALEGSKSDDSDDNGGHRFWSWKASDK